MSKAAYERGSRAIAAQMRQNERPIEFEIMENMNAVPKKPGSMAPFGEVAIFAERGVFFIECPITGRSFWYPTMTKLMASWRVAVTEYNAITKRFTAVPLP